MTKKTKFGNLYKKRNKLYESNIILKTHLEHLVNKTNAMYWKISTTRYNENWLNRKILFLILKDVRIIDYLFHTPLCQKKAST